MRSRSPIADSLVRLRPTFAVLGVGKSGTTTLWHLLRQHPEGFLPDRKALHDFRFDRDFRNGPA